MDGLRHSGIPLGGLGTGSVELRSDGYFHEWQIMNNAPWGAGPAADLPPDTAYFGMQVGERSLMLGRTTDYCPNLNDPYGLPFLEHAEGVEAESRAPFTTLRYRYPGLPVEVSLEAFSPFIPLDAKNSALPLAFFTFTIANSTARAVRTSVFMAQRNLVGYSERERKSEMTFAEAGGAARIAFGREGLEQDCPSRGSLCVGARADGDVAFSHVLHPRSNRDVYEPLRSDGRLEDADWSDVHAWDQVHGGEGLAFGVLCCTVELAPCETRRVTFALAWHFPEMWERPYGPKQQPAHRLGHRYARWFADADAVLDYAVENAAMLRRESLRFVEDFYASTLPRWLLDAVNAQLTTLVKASWWDEAGRFGIWEGLGCCGLQTTDITHYGSFPIVQFFPELQKSQMRLTAANFEGRGQVPHLMPGSFCCSDLDEKKRIDLIPQFVLLVWRDVLWTGDTDYAREMWPRVRDAVEYASTFDTDGDGLPNNRGPDQTYDQFPLRGTSAFVGLLYGASLRAAAEVARLVGEDEAADDLERRFADAVRTLREQLWNGSYYRLSYDPADGTANEGVMADQANADWSVRQTTGRGLLPDDEVRSALGAVVEHCWNGAYLANCVWPSGDRVGIPRTTANQADWAWSGVEYAVAAHLALLGMDREALAVARSVWDRHERQGMRFNHVECGQHYYRALSVWGLYLALSGFSMDATRGELALRAPGKADQAFVLCTPTGWGVVNGFGGEGRLEFVVRKGTVEVRSLLLRGWGTEEVVLRREGEEVQVTCEAVDGGLRVAAGRTLRLAAGERVTVCPVG